MRSMPKDGRRDLVQKGLEGGGGGFILKIVIAKGLYRGYNFHL